MFTPLEIGSAPEDSYGYLIRSVSVNQIELTDVLNNIFSYFEQGMENNYIALFLTGFTPLEIGNASEDS